MEKRELKRCPFCGGPAEFNEADARAWAEKRLTESNGYMLEITCADCDTEVKVYNFKEDGASVDEIIDLLVEKWNRRSRETELEEKVNQLEADLRDIGKESHEYFGKYMQSVKRNTILETALVMNELNKVCPELAAEYGKAVRK